MYSFTTEKRVRYSETDKMGYLYYGHYAAIFEIGRVETIRSLGFSYRDMEDIHGIWLPVVSLETRFVRPAYYDDLLSIRTEIRKIPDKYITFHTDVYNPENKRCAAGRVRLCFFRAADKKVIEAPAFLVEALKDSF